MQKIFLCLISALFISQSAWAQFTLEQLIQSQIQIKDLIEAEITLDSLISEFENRPGTSKSQINALLKNKKNRALIKDLQQEERRLIKLQKKTARPKRNKHFFGDASLAENATQKEIQIYNQILETAHTLLETQQIHPSTYTVSTSIIESLKFLHTHHQVIAQEYATDTESPTYGHHIVIHTEEKDVPFQLRAGILLDMLKKAFLFADKNDLLPAFFTTGLSLTSGCLEARLDHLSKWHADRHHYLTSLKNLSEEEQAKRLPDTAKTMIYGIIQAHFEEYSDHVEYQNQRKQLAQEIARSFQGKIDISGNAITPEVVNSTLKEVYRVDSRSSSPTYKRKILFEPFSEGLDQYNQLIPFKLDLTAEELEESDEINNRISLN